MTGWTPPGSPVPAPTWRDYVACAVMLVAALAFFAVLWAASEWVAPWVGR